ncbi:MAG TPA: hypothetical protein VH143_17535 [Kofleriaceae bacterium]|jgi:hypothetical protein|nr:hypothetical protein [Kofleriaceae bacterium]
MRPAILCALVVASCSCPRTAERTGDLAIVDVTVVPMSYDGVLPH